MEKRMKQIVAIAITAITLVSTAVPAYAARVYSNGGAWTDKENLTWTYNSGEILKVGNGKVFSEVHPEISDPEYYLKEYYCYPDEGVIVYNSQGKLKTPYSNCMDEALPLLQEFVHSFDWINSDESTRYRKVYERIANGQNGNYYSFPHLTERFQVLRTKLGVCEEFSNEFQALCAIVGIECVTYQPSVNHQACLMKINEQWLRIDPTDGSFAYSNSHLVPVDFETEYNRYGNELKNSESYKEMMRLAELQKQAEAGTITWREYFENLYVGKSLAEIEEYLGMDMESYEQLWR